ncbi:hypothetical protein N7462_006349 [Penicillium macrosclerotiorum]|uniref:uncharacterized protein n=1 Tax=Penicillium macrosclerotiorum TaxID=303699 RepID=UPI002547597D|nr:uncharacterized protein N7462_006349 [Penicillium macrosclerotiorum]KAJ5683184.1 hypothetical protein N7462_006349 [Penicillium macrosclerotiorum]
MSIVQENACAVNTQLDRVQQQFAGAEEPLATQNGPSPNIPSPLIPCLQTVIGAISLTSKNQPFLSPTRLADLLADPVWTQHIVPQAETKPDDEEELSIHLWLVAAKAAIQASGLVMHTLLDQTLQLHEATDYWNEVLGSVWNCGLYAAQTAPTRLWHWSTGISSVRLRPGTLAAPPLSSIAARWAHFYQIARQCISDYPSRVDWSAPIRSYRSEIRKKRDCLVAMKDIHTSSLGLIMEGWHAFQTEKLTTNDAPASLEQWQDAVSRVVLLTGAIVHQGARGSNAWEFPQQVLSTIENDMTSLQMPESKRGSTQQPIHLIQRLVHLLRVQLPTHTASVSAFIDRHGRPSRITRWWLPFSAVVLSGSISLRILVHRQAEIMQWIMDIGSTVLDFGSNWVVEPIRKLIGTIRHDEKSEIAIMSKSSLVADRASLERMVIDFVRDRPDSHKGGSAMEDTAAIANAVKEGDLTPVLRAYERDLRSPLVGTVRGDLVRALLIQIQKTKVDVEIAISGINALLKSQELVFGFVGLTPGILVSYSALRWLIGLSGSRRGLRKGKQQHELRRGLRNVSRILTSAPLSDGIIPYKDSGQLICEAEALLQKVKGVLGGVQYREFREDIQDLLDVQSGVDRQLQTVERMRWAYFH